MQEAYSGCTVEEGLEPGQAEDRQDDEVGTCTSGGAGMYWYFIGNGQSALPDREVALL